MGRLRHVVIHGHKQALPLLSYFGKRKAPIRFVIFQQETTPEQLSDTEADIINIDDLLRPIREEIKNVGLLAVPHYCDQILSVWRGMGYEIEEGDFLKELAAGIVDGVVTIEMLRAAHCVAGIDLVVVFDDMPRRFMYYVKAARAFGIPNLHVAHGIYWLHDPPRKLHADYTAVFGKYDKWAYSAQGNHPDRVIVTGNPDWDSLHEIKRELLRRGLTKERVKREMLCLDDGDSFVGRLVIVYASTWVINERARVQYFRHFLRFLEAVRVLIEQEEFDIHVTVKLHPQQPDETQLYTKAAERLGIFGLTVHRGNYRDGNTTRNWLLWGADLVVCEAMSSLLIEALHFDTPVLLIEEPHADPLLRKAGYPHDSIVIARPDAVEIRRKLADLLRDTPLSRHVRDKAGKTIEKYATANDGRRTEAVADLMTRMMEERWLWRPRAGRESRAA